MSDAQEQTKDASPSESYEEKEATFKKYDAGFAPKVKKDAPKQHMLDKVEQVVTDPEELRRMMGVKAVADVYKTLDKMQLRREFHDALARHGVTFDFLVMGIKGIAESAYKEADRIKAYQTLLKSLGMDKYDGEGAMESGSWEEVLMKKLEKPKKDQAQLAAPKEYDVEVPEMPESVRKTKEEEEEAMKGVYGQTTTST